MVTNDGVFVELIVGSGKKLKKIMQCLAIEGSLV